MAQPMMQVTVRLPAPATIDAAVVWSPEVSAHVDTPEETPTPSGEISVRVTRPLPS